MFIHSHHAIPHKHERLYCQLNHAVLWIYWTWERLAHSWAQTNTYRYNDVLNALPTWQIKQDSISFSKWNSSVPWSTARCSVKWHCYFSFLKSYSSRVFIITEAICSPMPVQLSWCFPSNVLDYFNKLEQFSTRKGFSRNSWNMMHILGWKARWSTQW